MKIIGPAYEEALDRVVARLAEAELTVENQVLWSFIEQFRTGGGPRYTVSDERARDARFHARLEAKLKTANALKYRFTDAKKRCQLLERVAGMAFRDFRRRSLKRSKVDGFDRRPAGEALQRGGMAQRRGPLWLSGVLKLAPGATKDFVFAASGAADYVPVEIRRGEVFGLAGTD